MNIRLLYKPIKRFRKRVHQFHNTLLLKQMRVHYCPNIIIKGKIYVKNGGTISLGEKVRINSSKEANCIGGDTCTNLVVKKGATLSIGDFCGISNSTIVCWNNITIGTNVLIGGGCKIWDTDFHSLEAEERIDDDTTVKTAPIHIDDRAFIGGGSIILKGVSIGNSSIVAAGSVVTKSIPPFEIWGGNPARFIRKIEERKTV